MVQVSPEALLGINSNAYFFLVLFGSDFHALLLKYILTKFIDWVLFVYECFQLLRLL